MRKIGKRVNFWTMLEIKKLPKSEVEITGEMPADEFAKFWQKAVAELSEDIKFPGFRPGHIPEKILTERVGEGAVLEKAAELALQNVYPGILQEKKIEAIGMPRASVTKIAKGEVLGYKFTTAVLPEIILPEDYKKITQEVLNKKEEIKVDEKEVEQQIDYIKQVREKNPDNKNLPEISDELKNDIRRRIKSEKELRQKEKQRLESLDAVLKKSEFEIPDILLESEKNKMLSETKAGIADMGLKWEDYLKHIKKEEKEVWEGWSEDAKKRVNYGLLLRRLAKVLDIGVTDKEIEDEISKIPQKEGVDKERLRDYIYGVIRNNKIFKFLEEI